MTIDNPYWDGVKGWIKPKGSPWETPAVDWLSNWERINREDFVHKYSWAIPDPDSIEFVTKQSEGKIIDPMAGTGYWAFCLAQNGVDCVAYDINPPDIHSDNNKYHQETASWVFIRQAAAEESVALFPDRTLLLSWPPYGYPCKPILDAYTGCRIIYIGEGEYGCCGDDALFKTLETDWEKIAEHIPVQWSGIHDVIEVYTRK